jgi:hypothetical protein
VKNLVEAHNRVKDFDWDFSYAERPDRYPTKYKIPAKTKDPFRHLIRDYCAMEREKDDRQYGALEDAIARSGSTANANERWIEILKVALPVLTFGEYSAMKSCGQLVDTVDNAALRQGYMAQMIDEVRHVNQELYLNRYMAKHARDPEGFNNAQPLKNLNVFGRAAQSALECFFVNDPIEGALNLQVVAETAYTNSIFVAMTQVAATNGDQATPTVFLSIQSDEARHMANGYSTLAAVLAEPDNLPMLQKDFDRAFWRQHAFLDPFINVVYDYFQKTRTDSYLEKWNEWLAEDWAGAYIAKLEPFGLKIPRWFDLAKERMTWSGHTAATLAFASWPLHFWRYDPPTDADMEWFEVKYPGWYDRFGAFWNRYRELCDPKQGRIPMEDFGELPPICRVCQMPCVFPTLDDCHARVREHEGRLHAFCSDACEFIFHESPARYLGAQTFDEIYDGWSVAEFVRKNGMLRADGKTLLAQPHLDNAKMWTIDDLEAIDFEIKNPLRRMAEQGAVVS